MGRPCKGVRRQLTIRVPEPVAAVLEERQAAAGASSLSQYVSDVLAADAGRADLITELHPVKQGVLPLGA